MNNNSLQFDNVSVIKKANIFNNGQCVSHTIVFADGSKKTVGVMFPGPLQFTIGAPEIMEIVEGHCRVKINDGPWETINAGHSFQVPENGRFDIEILETLHYVCHFGSSD